MLRNRWGASSSRQDGWQVSPAQVAGTHSSECGSRNPTIVRLHGMLTMNPLSLESRVSPRPPPLAGLVRNAGRPDPGRRRGVQARRRTLRVPDGFTIERMAGPPLVDRPITAAFDEQGRLYVADSSGSNDNVQKQLAEKPHRIVRLEDTDGDGKFDKRTVFADKMMFPEGTMWHDGSLYVAAPPSIWKLTDTDGDGVADQRDRVVPGQDAHRLRQRPARPLPRPRRLDLLVQGGVRQADLRAARQDAVRHPGVAHLPLPARRHRHRAGDDRRHGQPGRRRLHARRRADLHDARSSSIPAAASATA